MIVSGSVDRTAKVWEKLPVFLTGGEKGKKPWNLLCSLSDARGTVRAVEFAPALFGLKLVCT